MRRGKTHKLKATWSIDATKELNSFHHTDAAKAVADLVASQIRNEIDEEILKELNVLIEAERKFESLDEVDKLMVKAGYRVEKDR